MGCRCSKRIKTRTFKPGQAGPPVVQQTEEPKLSLLKQMWEEAKKKTILTILNLRIDFCYIQL